MSDQNTKKTKPHKGILKAASSVDEPKQERRESIKDDLKWDEMNILATHHPANKDYGHDKVDEPKTPYPYEMEVSDLDPELLATSLTDDNLDKASTHSPLHGRSSEEDDENSRDQDEDGDTDGADEQFKESRRKHYNEGFLFAFGRKLAQADLKEVELEEREEKVRKSSKSKQNSAVAVVVKEPKAGSGSEKERKSHHHHDKAQHRSAASSSSSASSIKSSQHKNRHK